MKYLPYEGEQLYVPQSIEEAKLVHSRIYDLLQIGYQDWLLWELPSKSSSLGEWFPASRIFPVGARHVDSLNNRQAPLIAVFDLALPTRFDDGVGLFSRISVRMGEHERHELDRLFQVNANKSIFRFVDLLEATELLVKRIRSNGKTEEV